MYNEKEIAFLFIWRWSITRSAKNRYHFICLFDVGAYSDSSGLIWQPLHIPFVVSLWKATTATCHHISLRRGTKRKLKPKTTSIQPNDRPLNQNQKNRDRNQKNNKKWQKLFGFIEFEKWEETEDRLSVDVNELFGRRGARCVCQLARMKVFWWSNAELWAVSENGGNLGFLWCFCWFWTLKRTERRGFDSVIGLMSKRWLWRGQGKKSQRKDTEAKTNEISYLRRRQHCHSFSLDIPYVFVCLFVYLCSVFCSTRFTWADSTKNMTQANK